MIDPSILNYVPYRDDFFNFFTDSSILRNNKKYNQLVNGKFELKGVSIVFDINTGRSIIVDSTLDIQVEDGYTRKCLRM